MLTSPEIRSSAKHEVEADGVSLVIGFERDFVAFDLALLDGELRILARAHGAGDVCAGLLKH